MSFSSVQARIAAFENGTHPAPSPSPSPPNLGRRSSLIDLHDAEDTNLIAFSPPTPRQLAPPRGHAPTSSISSFHSVSLSDPIRDLETASIDSYEDVSVTSSLVSPATERLINRDWEKAMATKSQPRTTYATYTPRRAAPPPPPSRASDRASVQSFTTTSSSHTTPALKTKRPTPVPGPARKRYEAVFNANVIQRRRAEKEKQSTNGRRAAGWRGLSVDLVQDDTLDSVVTPNDKLEAPIVKHIWKQSRLDNSRLAKIWHVFRWLITHYSHLSSGTNVIRNPRAHCHLMPLLAACGG